MNEWVLAINDDPVSRAQLDVCRQTKPALRGVVACHEAVDHATRKLCANLRAFPAFCNDRSNECTYGYREDFTDLGQTRGGTTPP